MSLLIFIIYLYISILVTAREFTCIIISQHWAKCLALNKLLVGWIIRLQLWEKLSCTFITVIDDWVVVRYSKKSIGMSLEPSGSIHLIMARTEDKITKGSRRHGTGPFVQTHSVHFYPVLLLTTSLPPLLFTSWISAMSLCNSWQVYLYSS